MAISLVTVALIGSRRSDGFVCKKPLTFPNYRVTWSANCRGVAQTGRALGSGLRGRWFKSSHPDQFIQGRKLLNRASDGADDIFEKQFDLFTKEGHRDYYNL
jgi:hypothetical protein